ncbi:sugar transferase [Nostocoides vanveenii]|uniref:Sugar transferase n=1 Tax=Nostocoides vanveenii TaxID=330835 RepID=A0ABP4XCF0_9MICO
MTGHRPSGYRGKRALDLLIGVPALIASLPVQAVIAWRIRRTMGSPMLFRQQRPGLHGVPFELMKFRTMRNPSTEDTSLTDVARVATDAERITPLGAFLRSTSLDELPTLINLVKGDVSLVGPRPLLMSYLDLYTPEQARRHDVRPGLTGLAQVSGRNALTWEEKFALDVQYVDRQGLLEDLRILARTILLVMRRQGISADGAATMPPFEGIGQR